MKKVLIGLLLLGCNDVIANKDYIKFTLKEELNYFTSCRKIKHGWINWSNKHQTKVWMTKCENKKIICFIKNDSVSCLKK